MTNIKQKLLNKYKNFYFKKNETYYYQYGYRYKENLLSGYIDHIAMYTNNLTC